MRTKHLSWGVIAVTAAACGGRASDQISSIAGAGAGGVIFGASGDGAVESGGAGTSDASGSLAGMSSAGDGGEHAAGSPSASDAGAAGTENRGKALWDYSWDVQGLVTFEANAPEEMEVCTQVFTLDFQTANGNLQAFTGRFGLRDAIALDRQPGGSVSGGARSLKLRYTMVRSPCGFDTATLSNLTLSMVGDRLFGSAQGTLTRNPQDVPPSAVRDESATVSVTFSGTRDTTAAQVSTFQGLTDGYGNPLGMTVGMSEPLASAALRLDGTPTVDLAPIAEGLSLFYTPQVLPFSGEWTVGGTARDFAGNLAAVGVVANTPRDPGVMMQDGFEAGTLEPGIFTNQGQNTWSLTNDDSGVTGTAQLGSPPAIAGSHSMFVLANASALFHLQRAPGQTKLSFDFEDLNPNPGSAPGVRVFAGAIGGTAGEVSLPNFPKGSAPLTATLTLPDGGTDVVVDFSGPSGIGYLVDGTPIGLLVDNLVIQ